MFKEINFYTQNLLDGETFTQRNSYTENLLHPCRRRLAMLIVTISFQLPRTCPLHMSVMAKV